MADKKQKVDDVKIIPRPVSAFVVENIQQGWEEVGNGVNKDMRKPHTNSARAKYESMLMEILEADHIPSVAVIHKSEEYFSNPDQLKDFTYTDSLSLVTSLALFASDLVTDILLSIYMDNAEDARWWFILTVALVIIPRVLVNLFSLVWYYTRSPTSSTSLWIGRITFHALGLGVPFRQMDSLYLGYHLKKEKENLMRCSSSGNKSGCGYFIRFIKNMQALARLEMMHTFLQDTPQVIFQLYFLMKRPPTVNSSSEMIETVLVQTGKILLGVLSISKTQVSFARTMRTASPHEGNLNPGASLLMFLWRSFTISSRVLAMSLVATVYPVELFIAIAIHFALMTIWVVLQRFNVHKKQKNHVSLLAAAGYDLVMGWIYVFAFVNVAEGPTRYKYLLYYSVVFQEDIAAVIIWFLKNPEDVWYGLPSLVGVPASFMLGIICMMIYYRYLHPSAPLPKPHKPASLIN